MAFHGGPISVRRGKDFTHKLTSSTADEHLNRDEESPVPITGIFMTKKKNVNVYDVWER